ncbi:MAG TPA: ATP-binding protein, partial [Verrucomicrobiae bacterium]
DQEFVTVFSGGRTGNAGCALFSSNSWQILHGEFRHPVFDQQHQALYLTTRNGVYVRRQPGDLEFDYLPVPGNLYADVAMADSSGNLWIGTTAGTYCYRPGRETPQAWGQSSVTELRRGSPLPVTLRARQRFENSPEPAAFRYSTRIDDGPWSAFQPRPEGYLSLPPLADGVHYLSIRARDVDGNISSQPARITFFILPDPIQNAVWFKPLLVLITGILVWLFWLWWANLQRIAQTNAVLQEEVRIRRQAEADLERARHELEHRVAERTAELTEANSRLKHEITERQQAETVKKLLEEQLAQSQKMQAIGTLAGGFAHDFNNILAVIIPYCELLAAEIRQHPEHQKYLTEILTAAHRARNLVQQILTFSRQSQGQSRQVCQIQPVVKEALKLLRAGLPSSIQMTTDIRPTHPILADATQIHQAIMNLAVNAQHAMGDRQGQLEVRLDEVEAESSLCRQVAGLKPGPYVRLTIRDTGCGIAPENLSRIFEPFFTTRAVGQGTGLGLAVVHGVVQSHDGAISVQSEVNRGTEFQLFFPAQFEVAATATATEPPPAPAHDEHLLLVDDEEAIIRVLKRLLVRAGYQVTSHLDPVQAWADFQTRPQAFDLVLSDLTMPGMNGLELAAKIREVRPELPILIATGFGGDLLSPEEQRRHPNIRRVVEKPLKPQDILQLLHQELTAKDRPAA